MGAGVVIRAHDGSFIAACRHQLPGIAAPEFAEALALRRAVTFAQEWGVDKAVFATDCLSLVQRLNSSEFDRSSVGTVVDGIKTMARSFTSASFIHVKRVQNDAAHLLAKSCETVLSSCVFSSVPDLILRTLCIDVI
jgi:hypothetical protein